MIDIVQPRLKTLKTLGFNPKSILDIGAHLGTWSVMVHEIWPEAEILMVEANKDCEWQLRKITFARTIITLLGRVNKKAVPYFASKKEYTTGNSIFKEQTSYFDDYETRKLEMKKLDGIRGEFDFIKIDTQGSELEIIAGGENVVKKAEFVLLETQSLTYNLGAPKTLDVIKEMDELGFDFFDITEMHHLPGGELAGIDILFARKDSKFIKKGQLW